MLFSFSVVAIAGLPGSSAPRPDELLWALVDTFSTGGNCSVGLKLLQGTWYANAGGPGTEISINSSNIMDVCAAGNIRGQTATLAHRYRGMGGYLSSWGSVETAILQGYRTARGVCGFVFHDTFAGNVLSDGSVSDMYEMYDAESYAAKMANCQGGSRDDHISQGHTSEHFSHFRESASPTQLCQRLLSVYGGKHCKVLPQLVTDAFVMHDLAAHATLNLNETIAACLNPLYSEDYVFFEAIETPASNSAAGGGGGASTSFGATYAFTVLDPTTNGPCCGMTPIRYSCVVDNRGLVASLSFSYDLSSLAAQMTVCHQKTEIGRRFF